MKYRPILCLDDRLDVVVTLLVDKRIRIGQRQPVDQRRTRSIGILSYVAVRDGRAVRQVVLRKTHGLDCIQILFTVGTRAA